MKKILTIVVLLLTTFILISCEKDFKKDYNNDVYYSLFVRSFADSNNDGIGDINGVTENLDYLNELGITAIWLLPIFESNSYHGYDTVNYYNIEPDYGTMEDFENLIKEAKKFDMKIMIDFVINHTSDQHEWYKDSDSSESSEYRDYYIWKNNSAYQSFPGGLMDLNLDNVEVLNEIHNIIDFYVDKGVLGFRFDAVKHFFEQDGPNLLLVKNMQFMHKINEYIKNKNKNIYVVAEVLENDYNIVSSYSRSMNSYFNFYIRNELINKVGHGSSSYLITSNLEKMYNSYREVNPDFMDSPIIGNHDFDRIASIATNEAKLKQTVNFMMTLPGSPFIYYGDELMMKGVRDSDNGTTIDGVTYYDEFRRQPFKWGDSRTTTWLVDNGSNSDTKSYLVAKEDPNSMFNTYKEIIELRKNTPALMYGNEFYSYQQGNIQGYLRVINDNNFKEAVLILHNLSDKEIDSGITLKSIFNNSKIEPYGTSIFKVDYKEIEEYKNVRN